jgi:hypothetical protein
MRDEEERWELFARERSMARKLSPHIDRHRGGEKTVLERHAPILECPVLFTQSKVSYTTMNSDFIIS